MYTISKNPYNDLPKLHFNYRLAELQEDVERTTSYLGKFRRTESAAHLQDLIAMTKDENNIFAPFAKEIAVGVYDEFRKGVLNEGDSSWKYKKSVVLKDIEIPPILTPYMISHKLDHDDENIIISNVIFMTNNSDYDKYSVELHMEVTYNVKYHMMYDPDIQIIREKRIKFVIPPDKIQNEGREYNVSSYVIPALLDAETDLTSKETIESVSELRIIRCLALHKNDIELNIGDVVSVGENLYEMIVDTTINKLNIKNDTINIDHLDVNDGVHYYVDLYSMCQQSIISTLDEAIKNALMYGVIWKWLMLAYPAEAETYASLYDNAKKEVYSRCNIFKRQHNKVPRIL